MPEGTVKWFNPRKGYGFIATPNGKDVFVHYASIVGQGYKTLAEGDPVSFDVVEGEKGLRAENVVHQSASETKPASETKDTSKSKPASRSKSASETQETENSEESLETEEDS